MPSTLCEHNEWLEGKESRVGNLVPGRGLLLLPATTSDCHAGEPVKAGIAGEFQYRPGENLAAPTISCSFMSQQNFVASFQVKSQWPVKSSFDLYYCIGY